MSKDRPWTRCPHRDVKFCPLYDASHRPDGGGCDDGRLGEGGCAVDRGLDYASALARLTASAPRLVAELAFEEDAAERAAQRRRNMRLLGLH